MAQNTTPNLNAKFFNRDVILFNSSLWGGPYGETLIVAADGTVQANLSVVDLTTTGNTTLGNASTDTLTVPSTSQFNAPVTVGVDDTGYDVKFFGATTGKSWLWDESADKMIVTGTSTLDGNVLMGSGSGITSSVTNGVVPFVVGAVAQDLSGAGAVTLTEYLTKVTNTGSDALTLASGTIVGMLKRIIMIVDPGTDSTLTFNGTSTIVFADVGDTADLLWNGTAWVPIALLNMADGGATAPVYTP